MLRVLARPSLINKVIKLQLKITVCSNSNLRLDPHVNPRYSYAFGRGTIPLIDENINYFLDKIEQAPKDDLLISFKDKRSIDNHQLVRDVRRLAAGIYHNLKLRRGDTVCLWSLNCIEWAKIFLACQSIGVTVCTVNPYYKEQELAFAMIKCKAKAIFLPGSESEQNTVNKYLTIFNSDHVKTELKNNGQMRCVVFIDENKKQVEFESYQLSDLEIDQKLDQKILDEVDSDDPALILYTSGTTGVPKGVVVSNFNTINNSHIASDFIMKGADDVIILPIPLFHSFALGCGLETMAIRNVKTVLTGYRYSAKDVIDSINEHKGTFLMATPTMVIDIIDYMKKNKIQTPSLTTILAGAASFPGDILPEIKEVMPHLQDVRIGYGMTESSPVITLSVPEDDLIRKANTVGRPIDHIEVKIVDPDTKKTVELEKEGELWARGHCVMIGYFEDEQKTKETITPNRWLRTGDVATMDKKGYIKIVGRIKEMIIKGGENIYPVEIENTVRNADNVLDAYVFPIPDKRLGEIIGCWIKLADPNIKTTEEDIKSYCKSKMTSYKVPNVIMFTDSFPMTITGKVKKFEMTRITCEKLGIEKK